MEVAEALKQVKAVGKRNSNYLVINLSYNYQILLPYNEGMLFVSSLEKAETLEAPYSRPPVIKGFDMSSIEFRVISEHEYHRHKVAQLMGVSLDNVNSLEPIQSPKEEA